MADVRKPSDAEQRAAVPAATQAAHAAQVAAEAAADAADAVGGAAAHAAERTVAAADAAYERVADTADDLKSKSGTKLCPTCKGELVLHGAASPHKAGAYHCNSCGSCWAAGIRELRAGHPAPAGHGA